MIHGFCYNKYMTVLRLEVTSWYFFVKVFLHSRFDSMYQIIFCQVSEQTWNPSLLSRSVFLIVKFSDHQSLLYCLLCLIKDTLITYVKRSRAHIRYHVLTQPHLHLVTGLLLMFESVSHLVHMENQFSV